MDKRKEQSEQIAATGESMRGLKTENDSKKKKPALVAPSILSSDFAHLANEIEKLQVAGADWIHVDVMDGHFVKNLTIGAPVVAALKKVSSLPLDVHLMIEKPERYVMDFIKAGADTITLHVESSSELDFCFDLLKQHPAIKKGITLRPGTHVDAIKPYLDRVDLVLIMTVEPGFGGQSFLYSQVDKIKKVRSWISQGSLPILLEVDGGINGETIRHCDDVDVIVAGNFVFKGLDYKTQIDILKNRGL